MLDKSFVPGRFHESRSRWIQSFSVQAIKILIVCRGPVRKEAIDVFEAMGVAEYGMLLSEKDSIVYPKCLAPELRDFKFPKNVHRVPEYMGMTAEDRPKRIREIIEIAKSNRYTHIFAGYGFMAEDAEFIEAIEQGGITFIGPSSYVAKRAGAKDEAKKLARSLGASVTPGVDAVTALALLRKAPDRAALEALAAEHQLAFAWSDASDLEGNAEALLQLSYAKRLELVTIADLQREATERCAEIWAKHPGRRVRFKYIGGGGGKGQRVIGEASQVAAAVMEILAESKVTAPGSNRNFLIELNIEKTRHNEIQLIGNGEWCLSLGGRDCSVQMHEQKLLELSLTQELLAKEIAARKETSPVHAATLSEDLATLVAMEAEAERFGAAVNLNSVSTFESIVDGRDHFFMEMNTRIQVEHRVTEMVYRLKFQNPENPSNVFYLDSLIEAMVLLSVHGTKVPKPTRELRETSGAEVRINATNQSLQPHAGGLIWSWSAPLPGELRDDQGIGTRNPDTGAFVFYNLAGAYDSNVALVITQGDSRKDNLLRLAEILRRTELRGYELQTNMEVHYGLLHWLLGNDPMAKPSTQFMASYLAAIGSLEKILVDVDLEFAWSETLRRHGPKAKDVLRRKETLVRRPIEKLFGNGHLLGGFLGAFGGTLWKREGADFVFATNPVEFVRALYHYLNLEAAPGKPACDQIWDHDDEILHETTRFYDRVKALVGDEPWPVTAARFAKEHDDQIAPGDPAKWRACVAAHRGFQAGLELLLLIPRIGKASGFLDIKLDEHLEPVFPAPYREPESRAELIKALSPAPVASSDEIVTPMGGYFFSREAPHLPPLIEEGQHFVKGQPLFVVEVMKMFNKVLAPFGGTVKRELMRDRDGQVIVKGQPMFKITPDEVRKEESPEDRKKRREAGTKALLG